MRTRIDRKTRRERHRFTLFIWGIGIFFILVVNLRAENMALLSVLPVDAPVIKEKAIHYSIKLIFAAAPKDYWWFFDQAQSAIVIEYYDHVTHTADSLSIKGSSPVLSVEVKNSTTTLVLSGKKTQVYLRLKEPLRSSVQCVNDTMEVNLWKDLTPKASLSTSKKSALKIVVISVLAAGISAAMTVSYLKWR
jgi:hypothetical protein